MTTDDRIMLRVEPPSDRLLFRFHARVYPQAEMRSREGCAAVYVMDCRHVSWFVCQAEDLGLTVAEARVPDNGPVRDAQ